MAKTKINTTVGITKPDDDCIVVAILSKQARQHITNLLEKLSQWLNGIIWAVPATALHITLCEIIQPKPYIEDKVTLHQNRPYYEEILDKLLAIPPRP